MPRYDYACTACDHRFEAVQAFTDERLTECGVCSGRLRRLISPVGVVFKGSGFYRNDSRPKVDAAAGGDGDSAGAAAKPDGKSDGKADAKAGGKVDGKSDSKSASSSEGKADSDRKSGAKGDGKSERKPDGKTPAATGAGAGSSTSTKSA